MKKPKKKIDIIFYLIKRMSRTDKRHFKLYNQIYKGKEKDFVKLFDLLNEMNSFDSEQVNEFFVGKKSSQKNICVSYLLTKVVESVDDGVAYFTFGGQKIIVPHMKAYRAYAKMELMELAWEELGKAEQLAVQYELFGELHRILQMKYDMMSVMNLNVDIGDRIELNRKLIALIEKMKIRQEIEYIISKIIKSPSGSEELENTYKQLSNYDYANLTIRSKIGLNDANYNYFIRKFNYKEATKYNRKSLDIYHEHPHFITATFENYLIVWNNLIVMTLRALDIASANFYRKQYELLYEKYNQLFKTSPDVIVAAYRLRICLYDILHTMITRDYENVKNIGEKTLKIIKEFPTSTSRAITVMSLFLRLAYGFLLIRDFKQAQFWLDKVFAFPYAQNFDMVEEAEVLNLIILYENQVFTLFESKKRSLKRSWKAKSPKSENAAFVLGLLQKVFLKRNLGKLPEVWMEAYIEILKIEKRTFWQLLFSRWIEQKM